LNDTPTQAELPALIEIGLRMVRHRIRASPSFSIYYSVQRPA